MKSELRLFRVTKARLRRKMRSSCSNTSVHGPQNDASITDHHKQNVCGRTINGKVSRATRAAMTDVGPPSQTTASSTTTAKKSKIEHGSVSSPDKKGTADPGEVVHVAGGEISGQGEVGERNMRCLSHGSISVIGRRRAMEDTVTVVPVLMVGEFSSYGFFAVYDGHGGSNVSHACRDRMHGLLVQELEKWTRGGSDEDADDRVCDRVDWEDAMASCFKKMDDEVMSHGDDNDNNNNNDDGGGSNRTGTAVSLATTGSTAVVVVVGKEKIVVANCGDSRAVLCRGGLAIPLSRDHKPDRPDERERVEAAGGKIIDWNGCRVLGVLATSRSIGDQYLKPYVISVPEVTVNKRAKCDNFIVVASDGIWDVLSNEVACEIVSKCLGGYVKSQSPEEMNGSYSMQAAAMLVELAMARGSNDNMSVIVVELNKLSS